MPALSISVMTFSERDAGPMVHTIFVFSIGELLGFHNQIYYTTKDPVCTVDFENSEMLFQLIQPRFSAAVESGGRLGSLPRKLIDTGL
jgi:hypothetical protein